MEEQHNRVVYLSALGSCVLPKHPNPYPLSFSNPGRCVDVCFLSSKTPLIDCDEKLQKAIKNIRRPRDHVYNVARTVVIIMKLCYLLPAIELSVDEYNYRYMLGHVCK